MTVYAITPVPAPRMTFADKWKKRPCVLRYRAFRDEVRLRKVTLPKNGFHVHFVLPMPDSWSDKKLSAMLGAPHEQKPDLDNLTKALLDAVYDDDAHVSDFTATKLCLILIRSFQIPSSGETRSCPRIFNPQNRRGSREQRAFFHLGGNRLDYNRSRWMA